MGTPQASLVDQLALKLLERFKDRLGMTSEDLNDPSTLLHLLQAMKKHVIPKQTKEELKSWEEKVGG